MTISLKKPCIKLCEAANTWGIFPRCAEPGRAVAYFEIAPTLGLKPQACTNLHIIYRSYDRDACGVFDTKYYVVTSWSWTRNKLKMYRQRSKQRYFKE